MTEKEWVEKLEQEGFTDIRICPLPPNKDSGEHTHDRHTVHVILTGELEITDDQGIKTYRPGDIVEFPAGTTHRARGSADVGSMIMGVKGEAKQ